ncbi:hypothetical protein [Bacteroides faecalis]|uniref:Uncharacterized protein n=1 Tax=Bacteroides faecalis TaxID=2447885 RepID=A0A401LW77_9BACE|nr:hypothetical protein [Bacteroides faecalis]GCB35778.1 hypothetical protein KGMB02408_27230 [Bacteroides faecalis]
MKSFKFILLFVLFLNFTITEIFAQYSLIDSFSDYSTYLSKSIDVSCKKPKNFIWETIRTSPKMQGSWERKMFVSSYIGKMQSKDGNYLILYPNPIAAMLSTGKSSSLECGCNFVRRQMIYDMGKASEETLPSDLIDLVGEDIIRIVGKDVPFNADTVFIVQIPLKEPYLGKYTYCVGIYACKSGRMPMGFKYYFTNEGKTREKESLLKFYETIRYRNNNNWSYDHEKALKTLLYELPHKSKK